MSLPWISVNSRLQNGIALMNSMPKSKFKSLLQHLAESDKDSPIFTQEELRRLGESLKLDPDNLQILIQSLAFIMKQSLKVMLKPTILQDHLVQVLKLEATKAEDFVSLWTKQMKDNFDLNSCKRLEAMSWELDMTGACTFQNKQTNPNARIHLSVNDAKEANIVVDLDEQQVQQLYNVLEKIQTKLDCVQ